MTAQSQTADAFGASVSMRQDTSAGLYLVIGTPSVPTIVRSNQGRVVTTLGDGRYLAVMTLEASSATQRHHEVRLCGPVTVDAQRFNAFLNAVGVQAPP